MSSGLIAERPSPLSTPPHSPAEPNCWFCNEIPSIMYRGWLAPLKELLPLITTLADPFIPVAPLLILTPATLPRRACNGFPDLTRLTSSPLS